MACVANQAGQTSRATMSIIILRRLYVRVCIHPLYMKKQQHCIVYDQSFVQCRIHCRWSYVMLCNFPILQLNTYYMILVPWPDPGIYVYTYIISTWNLKMKTWKRRFLLKVIIFRFHLSLWPQNSEDLSSSFGPFPL